MVSASFFWKAADAGRMSLRVMSIIVIASMQDAIEKAAKTRYGAETEIRAEINPKTGELKLTRLREVVELCDRVVVLPSP